MIDGGSPETCDAMPSARDLTDRGNVLVRSGRLTEALDYYHRALGAQPSAFEARANLGGVLVALGRFAAAEPHLRLALAQRPEQAPLHDALGVVCVERGKAAEAEVHLRRALQLAPERVEMLRHLGNALCQLHRYDEAETVYRHAVQVGPDDSESLAALADLLRRQKRFADAEHLYRRAVVLHPDNAAVLYGLGHCLAEAGRIAEACDSLTRAIIAKPDYIDAYYRLVLLGDPATLSPCLPRLEALTGRVPSLPAQQQVHFWFALGRLRENAQRYDVAFEAYATGNRIERDLHHLDDYPAHREPQEARFADRIAATFSGEMLRTAPRPPVGDPRVPIFIVGMPRSGTSLVEEILAAHPAIYAGGELGHWPEVLREFWGFDESRDHVAYPEVVPTLTANALRNVGQTYLDRVWQLASGVSHITDKLTGNFLHAGMIHLALPQAKIVHVVRDPIDVCFSCFANVFENGSVPYTYDLATLGRHCARYLALMRHWRQLLPADAMLEVRYEDLVVDTEAQIRRLLAYIGLPWDARCLEFHSNRRAVHTVSLGQVRRPVYRSSIARWKPFEAHLGPLLEGLGLLSVA